MNKPIKPILFAVIVLAATVSVFYILSLLDQIVHGQLYNYGLQFSLEWANPYWNLLRITQILLGVIAISTAANAILTFREYVHAKKPSGKMVLSQKPRIAVPSPTRTVEKISTRSDVSSVTPTPQTPPTPLTPPVSQAPTVPPEPITPTAPQAPPTLATSAPTPKPLSSEIPGLIKCFHCGKAFSQPLRMLDFQGDRPRIVNICPFCNEIIPTSPPQDEKEQNKRLQFKKKNNNHAAKALASQPTS